MGWIALHFACGLDSLALFDGIDLQAFLDQPWRRGGKKEQSSWSGPRAAPRHPCHLCEEPRCHCCLQPGEVLQDCACTACSLSSRSLWSAGAAAGLGQCQHWAGNEVFRSESSSHRDSEAVSWCEGKIHTEPAGNPQWWFGQQPLGASEPCQAFERPKEISGSMLQSYSTARGKTGADQGLTGGKLPQEEEAACFTSCFTCNLSEDRGFAGDSCAPATSHICCWKY